MPAYRAPGVYIEEVDRGPKAIEGVSTSTAGFLGETERGPTDPEFLTSFTDFERKYGGFKLYSEEEKLAGTYLAYAVEGFFRNGGRRCFVGRVTAEERVAKASLYSGDRPLVEPRSNELGVSPEAISFGTIVVGDSAEREVTLTNLGGASDPNITVSDVEVDGGDAGEFLTDLNVVLEPGESATIDVTFEPADAGDKTPELTVTHTGSNEVSVPIEATAVDPTLNNLAVSPDPIEFGAVRIGATATETITLTNVGGEGDLEITIEEMTLGGDDPGEFSRGSTSDNVLDPGETATIDVTFEPTSTGTKGALLTIDHTGDNDVSVRLKGDGPPQSANELGVSSETVEFGSVAVDAKATEAITLANLGGPGDPDITVERTSVGEEDRGEFTGGNPSDDVLGPGDMATISVHFRPTSPGPKRASLVIDHTGNNDVSVDLEGGEGVGTVDVSAVGPGVWGGHVAVFVTDSSQGENRLFDLTIRYWIRDEDAQNARAHDADPEHREVEPPDVEEVYDNLSPVETSSNYYKNRVNGVSNLVELERMVTGRPSNSDGKPTWLEIESASSGSAPSVAPTHYRGTITRRSTLSGEVVERTGLKAFEAIDEISIVCVPDENNSGLDGLRDDVVNHCESMEDRFAVLQAPQTFDVGSPVKPVDSKYAAFYLPWIKVRDPGTNLPTLVPPGGHVVGIYARNDTERGVHKAPANEVVRGASELQFNITKAEQDLLNPRGINCIRSFPGRGIRVWGARTVSSDPLWKYVNVRRLFLYIEESIDEGTQWVVFEPNDESLWARVRQTIANFLTTVWRDGALMGTTPEEAFYVKCDRTTMTQDDIDNGRLICEIGVAPVKPAEFVIFRISQWTGGAEGT